MKSIKPLAANTSLASATRPGPLPCGALTVTVTRFRSLGAITPLEATLGGWTGFQMPGGAPLPEPAPTLTLTGNNVVIKSEYPVRLIFNLPDPRYILVGVAWDVVEPSNSVGQTTFPEVLSRRNVTVPVPYQPAVPGGSCLTIVDNAQDQGTYEYALIIQEVDSGEIGLLDPGMDNDPI